MIPLLNSHGTMSRMYAPYHFGWTLGILEPYSVPRVPVKYERYYCRAAFGCFQLLNSIGQCNSECQLVGFSALSRSIGMQPV